MKHHIAVIISALSLSACTQWSDLARSQSDLTPSGGGQGMPAPELGLIPAGRPQVQMANTAGSLWRSGPENLFGDSRARDVGDVLTVIIEMNDKAEFSNKSNENRKNDTSLSISNLFGLETLAPKLLPGAPAAGTPLIGMSGSSKTAGDGAVNRSEKITLKVAAVVTNMLPNGNLVLRGSQEIRVNSEVRDLQITGVVRPRDIARNNTVSYDKIAEARISYGGRGQITAVQSPSTGGRILNALMPF